MNWKILSLPKIAQDAKTKRFHSQEVCPREKHQGCVVQPFVNMSELEVTNCHKRSDLNSKCVILTALEVRSQA